VSAVVLLHDLADAEAGTPWREVVPDHWVVPDLPGHGEAPAPRHGAYDPMGPATLARWMLGGAGTVVGVGRNAHGALILAAGGGCEAVAIVDGLWGPWPTPDGAIAAQYATLRALLADEAAVGPPPPSGLDPRTAHGYGVSVSAAFAQRFWGAIACPVLAIETPASTTPPTERAQRVAWFGGPATLVEIADPAPAAVIAALVHAWPDLPPPHDVRGT
jgi:hypothetical protein